MSQRTRTDRQGRSILLATVTTAEQPRSNTTLASRSESDSDGVTDVLSFPDVEELYRTFTPKALELLDAIRRERPASITETARLVGRDVKNVHTELHRLDDAGAVSFVDDGRATRPVAEYDEVRLRVSFDEGAFAPDGTGDRSAPTEIPEAVYGRITDAVLSLDPAARVTYANERAEELLEHPTEEVVGSVIWNAFPEATGTVFEDQYRRAVRTQEPVSGEGYFGPHDAWFAVRAYPTETGVTAYFRDVTDRKRREQRLENQRAELAAINHLNGVIREITRMAIETPSRERIEQRLCEQLVDTERYAFAWIGSIERGTRDVTWDCMAGGDRSYLEACRTSIERTDPHGRGPTGTAIRTHEPQFVQDMRTDPDYGSWRSEALERGFRASAAIPIAHDGVLYSVLNLYATRPNAFTKPVREALGHLGTVIGYAIHAAEQRTALLSESVREIELRNEDFAQRLVGSDSEVQLSVDRTVPTGEGRILHFMEVSEMSTEEFVDSITRVPTVEEVTLLEEDERDGSLVFEVTIAEPSLTGTLVSYGGRVRSVQTTADGTRIVAQLPPSVPIREVVEAVNEVHPGTELIAQRAVEREPRTTREIYSVIMDRLTEKQRAALETAYFAGYFEWPRSVTGEDVAAMLGITAPTFTNHMRIAERKLLAVLFSDDTDPISLE